MSVLLIPKGVFGQKLLRKAVTEEWLSAFCGPSFRDIVFTYTAQVTFSLLAVGVASMT